MADTRTRIPRETVREPLQTRSRETLEALRRSAAELLEERPWDAISVAEIARRAGASVGAFYGRFRDKDALLDHLDELYTAEVVELVKGFSRRARELTLESLLRELARELVVFHRQRRGLVRALVLRARSRREPRFDDRTRRMNATLPTLLELIVALRAEIGHPDPERAAFFAFSFLLSALRDRVLFPESVADPYDTSDEELAEELAHAAIAYLTMPTGPRARAKGEPR